jgi:hypothetical protein
MRTKEGDSSESPSFVVGKLHPETKVRLQAESVLALPILLLKV